jgi:hypothetical protein
MRWLARIVLLAATWVLTTSCGQEEAEFPETNAYTCGSWYPGGGGGADGGVDGGTDDPYAVEEGAIFPCDVAWDSAMLAGADTFINVSQIYLEAKHGLTDTRAIVIVVGAEHCPTCGTLMTAMSEQVPAFNATNSVMIAMARRDLQGVADAPDFDMATAYDVLANEGWPVDQWYSINDEEDYIPTSVDVGPPWVIIVSVKDMVVQVMANNAFATNEEGATAMIEFLSSPTFD